MAEPTPSLRRRYPPLLLFVAVFLLGTALTMWFVNSDMLKRVAANMLERGVERQYGIPLQVGRIDWQVRLFEPSHLRIENVVWPGGPGQPAILARVGAASASVRDLSLRGGFEVDLDDVSIEDARAVVRLEGGEFVDVASVVQAIRARSGGGGRGPRIQLGGLSAELALTVGLWPAPGEGAPQDGAARLAPERARLLAAWESLKIELVSEEGEPGRRLQGRFTVPDFELSFGQEHYAVRGGEGRVRHGPEGWSVEGLPLGLDLLSLSASVFGGSGAGLRYAVSADSDLERVRERFGIVKELSGSVHLEGAGTVVKGSHEAEVQVDGRGVGFFNYDFGDVRATARLDGKVLDLREARVDYAGGVVRLFGRADLASPARWQARADLEQVELAQVFDATGVENARVWMVCDGTAILGGTVAKPFRATGEAFLRSDRFQVLNRPWSARREANALLTVRNPVVLSDLVLEGYEVRLHNAHIMAPHGTDAQVDVTFDTRKVGGMDLRMRPSLVHFDDLKEDPSQRDGHIVGLPFGGRVIVSGNVAGTFKELVLQASLGPQLRWDPVAERNVERPMEFRAFGFDVGNVSWQVHWAIGEDLRFENMSLRRGASRGRGELRLETGSGLDLNGWLEIPDGRAEDLVTVIFPWLEAEGAMGLAVTLDGDAGDPRMDVLFDWYGGAIEGQAVDAVHGDLAYRQRRWTFRDLSASRADARVDLRGSMGSDGSLNLDLRSAGLRVGLLDHAAPLRGTLSGDLEFSAQFGGTRSDPLVRGNLDFGDALLGGTRLADSRTAFELKGGRLEWTGDLLGQSDSLMAEVRLDEGLPTVARWSWKDLDVQSLLPDALHGGLPFRMPTTGRAVAEGRLSAPDFDLDVVLDAFAIQQQGLDLRAAKPVHLSWMDGVITLDPVQLIGPFSDLEASGSVQMQREGAVDVQLSGKLDPGVATLFTDAVRQVEAEVVEVEAQLRGSRRQPQLRGSVELARGSVVTSLFPEPVLLDRMRVLLVGNAIRVDELVGTLGGGELQASGGVIELQGIRPVRYDLGGRCTGCRVHFPSFLPPSFGDVRSLTLKGSPSDLVLAGEVEVRDMAFTRSMDWTDVVRRFGSSRLEDIEEAGDDARIRLDIGVRSDAGIRLENNLGRARASADLRVIGTEKKPTVRGQVWADGGEVQLRNRSFQVEDFSAEFRPEDPTDPVLDASVATLVEQAGASEQEYTIRYQVLGPLSDLQVESSADPQLSEADINSILVFGVTTEQLADAGAEAWLEQLTTLAASGIISPLVRASGEVTWFVPDRLEVIPDPSGRSGSFFIALTKGLGEELRNLEVEWLVPLVFESPTTQAALRLRPVDALTLEAWLGNVDQQRTAVGGNVLWVLEVE
jgi:hypothetical protein